VQNGEPKQEYQALSLVISQRVMTWLNGSFNDCGTLFVFRPQMLVPASLITSIASGLEALHSIQHLRHQIGCP
jgi:hypothetical protein